MKHIEIVEGPISDLAEYAAISIAFEVDRVLAPDSLRIESGELRLVEQVQDPTYSKDYDAIEGGHPTDWPKRFDVSAWGMLSARRGNERLGGAILVHGSPGIKMLEGRSDLAVLWDIRVAPKARREGIGSALLRAAERWAQSRGCSQIKVETQNINVAACRFYERHGFELRGCNPSAYSDFPDETQLLWYRSLAPASTGPG